LVSSAGVTVSEAAGVVGAADEVDGKAWVDEGDELVDVGADLPPDEDEHAASDAARAAAAKVATRRVDWAISYLLGQGSVDVATLGGRSLKPPQGGHPEHSRSP
jgi:hypothetical protein